MLKSLFWIGATGVALVAGVALYHGDDIERAGHEIAANVERFEGVGQHFEREFDEAESAIAAGADEEESYEDAVAAALVSSGIITLGNIDEIDRDELQRSVEVDNGVRIEIVDVMDRARIKLDQARQAGDTIESRNISGGDIEDLLDLLEDLEALEGQTSITIQ